MHSPSLLFSTKRGELDSVKPQESFVKFTLTSRDGESPSREQAPEPYSSAPSPSNPLGLFQMKTKFSQRKTNPAEQSRLLPLVTHELYNYQYYGRQHSAKNWVMHSGPPFANGGAHLGHFLNMVQKDAINRYKLMRGHRVHMLPGFDCYGVGIEDKALHGDPALNALPRTLR